MRLELGSTAKIQTKHTQSAQYILETHYPMGYLLWGSLDEDDIFIVSKVKLKWEKSGVHKVASMESDFYLPRNWFFM